MVSISFRHVATLLRTERILDHKNSTFDDTIVTDRRKSRDVIQGNTFFFYLHCVPCNYIKISKTVHLAQNITFLKFLRKTRVYIHLEHETLMRKLCG